MAWAVSAVAVAIRSRYAFLPLAGSDGDDLEQLLPADGSIDLTPIIRDYAILDIPISQVCKLDCKGLCPICGANLNEEDCGHRQESVDPRLAGLKEMLEKSEKDS